jgi:hypothetical protein
MSFSYTINRQIHDMSTLQLEIFKAGLTDIAYITGTYTSITVFFGVAQTTDQQTILNNTVTNYIDAINESTSTELISRINATSIPLASNGIFEGVYDKVSGFSTLSVNCLTDSDCTLMIYFSNDGTTDHLVSNYAIKTNVVFIEIKTISFLYYKIRIINGYLGQTKMTMQSTANLYKTKNVIDTTQVNEVSIKTEEVKTAGNFKTTSLSLNIPGNTTSIMTFVKPYRISVLEFTFRITSLHSYDIINAYIGKNTTVGILASNAYINNTSITVSNSVIDNIYVGYDLTVSDGTNTNFLGEVLTISGNVLTFVKPMANNFLVGNYVIMSVKPVDNFVLGHEGLYNIGASKRGASGIPANTIISLEYTNTSSNIKTFTLNLDYLY